MSKIILEVCVDAPDDAVTAASAGADRLELCASLETGGLTPSGGLVRGAKSCDVPLFAMIRPRAGDFHYSEAEISCMLADIENLQECGVSGFVFGALDSQRNLAEKPLERLIAACNGMPATLHRAFDLCSNPLQTLDLAVQLGFERILTSGASSSVSSGLPLLEKLFAKADERIIIVPGGGVTPATVTSLLDHLPIREIHASCKSRVSTRRKTSPDVNIGRNDMQERFHTDSKILGELLDVIHSWQKAKSE